ncbi:MAG: NAD(P)-dependent dehydrogenase (short-subunit alcohol dehydrogenase family), partial [Kiritimatiellia bacterium]
MHVVITGASHGIGAASALAFANLPGARLTLVARREQMLKAVAGQCRELGAAAQVVTCDVTDADKVSQMAASAVQWAGTPAVLLNNAGRFAPSTVAETPVAEFLDQISVNLVSAYLVT